jgi:hypothetical protein
MPIGNAKPSGRASKNVKIEFKLFMKKSVYLKKPKISKFETTDIITNRLAVFLSPLPIYFDTLYPQI